MPNQVRWGILSTANINKALLEPIRKAERSELFAVASRDQGRAEAYAQREGIVRAYGSYEAMLADPEVDAVYISLPNALHAEWTVKAAEAGKHVLCEKPLVVTLDEFDRVEAAAQANGVHVVEAFMYLHHPQTQRARQLIDEGRLGALQLVNSWFNFYLPPERSENIRLSSELTGGSLWDVGVYPNSAAIYMAQPQQPERVWASQIVGESGVDVAMRAQVAFSGAAVGQISSGFRTPFREGLFLVGDEATLHIPEPWKPGLTGKDSAMTLTGRDGKAETIVTAAVDPYLCEVQAMEASILDGAAPVVSLALSRVFLRTALAIYASARSGEVMAV
ncbi:MAG: Gfo/Idh/MocA family oxidoreductase [Caldilineaceae bacterium]|nr:Gfo/Idh/MocA family oxidoreductase [Caldilineaceae bacterium]